LINFSQPYQYMHFDPLSSLDNVGFPWFFFFTFHGFHYHPSAILHSIYIFASLSFCAERRSSDIISHARFPALSRVIIPRVDRTESAVARKKGMGRRTDTTKDLFISVISSRARFKAANLSRCITLSVLHINIKQSLSNCLFIYECEIGKVFIAGVVMKVDSGIERWRSGWRLPAIKVNKKLLFQSSLDHYRHFFLTLSFQAFSLSLYLHYTSRVFPCPSRRTQAQHLPTAIDLIYDHEGIQRSI